MGLGVKGRIKVVFCVLEASVFYNLDGSLNWFQLSLLDEFSKTTFGVLGRVRRFRIGTSGEQYEYLRDTKKQEKENN